MFECQTAYIVYIYLAFKYAVNLPHCLVEGLPGCLAIFQNKLRIATGAGMFQPSNTFYGNVEKRHQRRSRHFAVLTYWKYAPRFKIAAALLDDFFDHSRQLLVLNFLGHIRAFL